MNEYSQKYFMLKKENIKAIIERKKTFIRVAEEMNVSRQTVHKWVSRYKRFGEESLLPKKRVKRRTPPKNKTSEKIENIVLCFAEEYWNDGVESLQDRIFAERSIEIHSSTLYRILKRRGVRYTNYWTGTKKRRKKQLYAHKEAGLELQMDTKYPFGYKVGKVIYTVIDDASRWTYAAVYSTANAENTLDFIEKLIKFTPFDIQKIRTDRGTEFVNRKVSLSLKQKGIVHRKNTPYCPEENGKIERFHRTLNEKSIQYYWFPSDSIQTLEYKLRLFLQWYNFSKRHRGLFMNNKTPFQKLLELSSLSVNLSLQCNMGQLGRKVSNVAIMNWIKSFGEVVMALKKAENKNLFVRTMEFDEMWHFAKKNNPRFGSGLHLIEKDINPLISFWAAGARKQEEGYGKK